MSLAAFQAQRYPVHGGFVGIEVFKDPLEPRKLPKWPELGAMVCQCHSPQQGDQLHTVAHDLRLRQVSIQDKSRIAYHGFSSALRSEDIVLLFHCTDTRIEIFDGEQVISYL